jgi:N-acetylglucosamine-6-phosphate deacetylase
MGHSGATYAQGLAGLEAGATALTHTLNAMAPLNSREPGLAGLVSLPSKSKGPLSSSAQSPYYSIIPDGHHLHPATVSLLYASNPQKAILITDSIELCGLPDGVYPGHSQIPSLQRKNGTRATIDGTDTLIGGCISLQQCVKNLLEWSGCNVAQAVKCVTENVASLMKLDQPAGRGVLREGYRADFVVLNDEADVLETWIAGRKVWENVEE